MKKIIALLLAVLMIFSLLVGCAAEARTDSKAQEQKNAADLGRTEDHFPYAYSTELADEPYIAEAPEAEESTQSIAEGRKLIRSAGIIAETEELDALLQALRSKVAEAGGYVESMSDSASYASDARIALITVRVPADRLDELLNTLEDAAHVVSRSENTQDVTLAYTDTENQRDALRIEQERLMALLEKAETLADLLELENRLTDVRYRLEGLESELRTYDNQVEYATVRAELREVQKFTPIPDAEDEKGFWEKIGDGFVDSAKNVWKGITAVFSVLLVISPYLLVAAVLALIILTPIVVTSRRKKKNAAKVPPTDTPEA